MLYTPVIDNPNRPSAKQVILSQCSTIAGAVNLRKAYIDENFKKESILATKSKHDAVSAVAIERLKDGNR